MSSLGGQVCRVKANGCVHEERRMSGVLDVKLRIVVIGCVGSHVCVAVCNEMVKER